MDTYGPSALGRWFSQKVLRRDFVRHVGVLTFVNGAQVTLSFVQGILVARWLGSELYGVAALVMSYPIVIHTIFDARSSDASVRYLSEFHAKKEHARALAMCKLGYAVDLSVATMVFLVVCGTAGWVIPHLIHHPEMTCLVVLYALGLLPQALVGTSYAILATLGKFPIIALITIVTSSVRAILILGLVGAGWQVTGLVWGNAGAIAVTGLLYAVVAHVFVRRTWGKSWLWSNWSSLRGYRKRIFSFLAHNDLTVLLAMIPKQLDIVLIGYFRNSTEVGYYKLAKGLTIGVDSIVRPLQSVAYPELARIWSIGDKEGFFRKLHQLAWRVGVPLALVVLLGTALVPVVLPIMVGEAYYPAVLATQILLVGSTVWLMFFWLRPAYIAMALVKNWAAGIGVYSLVFTILSLLTVGRWGYVGVALSLMAVTVLFHIGMGALMHGTYRDSRGTL